MIQRRSLSRLREVLPLALAGLLLAGTSSGSDEQELSFESTQTEERCGHAARVAGSDQCDVATTASAGSRAVSARTHLVSPYHGRTPWTAQASGTSDVVATYQLTEPTPELDFEIKIRVNRARVSLADSGLPSRWWGRFVESQLGRAAQIQAGATASHSDCSDCGGVTRSELVLSSRRPGTTKTISGEDLAVFHLNVDANDEKVMPPGEITIRAGTGATVWQTNGWGDDVASVDAVVEKIALS